MSTAQPLSPRSRTGCQIHWKNRKRGSSKQDSTGMQRQKTSTTFNHICLYMIRTALSQPSGRKQVISAHLSRWSSAMLTELVLFREHGLNYPAGYCGVSLAHSQKRVRVFVASPAYHHSPAVWSLEFWHQREISHRPVSQNSGESYQTFSSVSCYKKYQTIT